MKLDLYLQEIVNRGFMVEMECGYAGRPHRQNTIEKAVCREKRRGLRLYVLEGYRKYSRNESWYQKFVYLAGVENGVYWAVRCPSTVKTIDQALDYTTPAAAKNAKKQGKRVLRQGDVFIIEKKSGTDNLNGLPDRHYWYADTREMVHSTHKTIKIPFAFSVSVGKSVNSKAD